MRAGKKQEYRRDVRCAERMYGVRKKGGVSIVLTASICDLPRPQQQIRMACSHSPVAQLVEQPAVNRLVVGSSPTGGAESAAEMRLFRYFPGNSMILNRSVLPRIAGGVIPADA